MRTNARVGRGVRFNSANRNPASGPAQQSETVAEAVANGTVVRLPKALATEVRYDAPVVLTRAAYQDAVRWERTGCEAEDLRGYDVLWMAKRAALDALRVPGQRFLFTMQRVENRTMDGHLSSSIGHERISLDVVAQPFDRSGRACIIVMLSSED